MHRRVGKQPADPSSPWWMAKVSTMSVQERATRQALSKDVKRLTDQLELDVEWHPCTCWVAPISKIQEWVDAVEALINKEAHAASGATAEGQRAHKRERKAVIDLT